VKQANNFGFLPVKKHSCALTLRTEEMVTFSVLLAQIDASAHNLCLATSSIPADIIVAFAGLVPTMTTT
jgi:hypothetical protein